MKKKILTLMVLMCMLTFTVSCGSSQASKDNKEEKVIMPEDITAVYTQPNNYKGYLILVGGKAFNIQKSSEDGYVQFQILESGKNNHNTVILTKDKVEEDEYVQAIGTIKGEVKDENLVGQPITMLQINDATVTKVSPDEAMDPTLKSIKIDKSIEQNSVKMTLKKIGFGTKTSKIHLTITNNSSSSYDPATWDDPVAIQNNKQFDEYHGFFIDRPESRAIAKGISKDYIILLDKFKDKGNVKITIKPGYRVLFFV